MNSEQRFSNEATCPRPQGSTFTTSHSPTTCPASALLHRGAVGFFIGDSKGRSGWEVKLPDGSTEIYYVQWPEEVMTINVLFASPPGSHLGRPIRDRTAESLGKLYFEYLHRMLADARRVFAPP